MFCRETPEFLNPWVRCGACGKAHIAINFAFTCSCGATVDLVAAKIVVAQ